MRGDPPPFDRRSLIADKASMNAVQLSQLISGVGMGLLMALEWRNPRFRSGYSSDTRRAGRNRTYVLASLLTMAAFSPLIRGIEAKVPKLLPVSELPYILELLGVFMVAEFLNWTVHFLKHRSHFFWKLHFQHHADSEFNLSLSAHTHAGEVLVSGLLMALIISGLGFSAKSSQIYLAFYSVTTLYQHSSALTSLGWLDWVIVSPAYHRIHHEVGAQTNYAGRLTLFDVLFRTATWPSPERKNSPLGIGEEAQEPWGFIPELFHFLTPTPTSAAGLNEPLQTERLLSLPKEINTRTVTPEALPVLLKERDRATKFKQIIA